jgi:hypothetical protein
MDETRRFLRYVLPGALFAIEAILLLRILVPEWITPRLVDLGKNSGFGLAIGGLLGSGALGFLFSTVHHWLYWRQLHWGRCWLHPTIDHKSTVSRLRSAGVLALMSTTDVPVALGWPTDEHQGWAIVNGLWHERVLKDSKIQAANARADTLSDVVHSLGAGMVASVAALVTVPFIVKTCQQRFPRLSVGRCGCGCVVLRS